MRTSRAIVTKVNAATVVVGIQDVKVMLEETAVTQVSLTLPHSLSQSLTAGMPIWMSVGPHLASASSKAAQLVSTRSLVYLLARACLNEGP